VTVAVVGLTVTEVTVVVEPPVVVPELPQPVVSTVTIVKATPSKASLDAKTR
jgi:hypothetical protein